MDYTALAKDAGCLDTACEDVTRRLEARFQGEEPTPQAVKAWLEGTLRPQAAHLWPQAQALWDKLGLSKEAFDKLPPGERWALDRQHNPQPVVPRRPNPHWRPTPEQVEELAAIPNPHARVTAYRAMEAAARTQAARQRQG